ncbi:MAG: hypothetical protein RIK87_21240 [Fuerstiella sp.]
MGQFTFSSTGRADMIADMSEAMDRLRCQVAVGHIAATVRPYPWMGIQS